MTGQAKEMLELATPIKIVDVLVSKGYFGRWNKFSVVLDRMPMLVYQESGQRLTAYDSGFYDFLCNSGGTDAFAGRKFTIQLAGGRAFECHGQVWSVAPYDGCEEVVSVGVSTINRLQDCYVFTSASISKALLREWLANNAPSFDYYKYDPRGTVEWAIDLLEKNSGWLKPISAARARKLKQRGAHIFRGIDGQPQWSRWLEQHKAKIEKRQAEAASVASAIGGWK